MLKVRGSLCVSGLPHVPDYPGWLCAAFGEGPSKSYSTPRGFLSCWLLGQPALQEVRQHTWKYLNIKPDPTLNNLCFWMWALLSDWDDISFINTCKNININWILRVTQIRKRIASVEPFIYLTVWLQRNTDEVFLCNRGILERYRAKSEKCWLCWKQGLRLDWGLSQAVVYLQWGTATSPGSLLQKGRKVTAAYAEISLSQGCIQQKTPAIILHMGEVISYYRVSDYFFYFFFWVKLLVFASFELKRSDLKMIFRKKQLIVSLQMKDGFGRFSLVYVWFQTRFSDREKWWDWKCFPLFLM